MLLTLVETDIATVAQLDLTYPKVDTEKKKELATMHAALARET